MADHVHVWGDGYWWYVPYDAATPDFHARCVLDDCAWNTVVVFAHGASCDVEARCSPYDDCAAAMAAAPVSVIEPDYAC